ncbi:hypothetical protein BJY00DRAFT_192093 [Aspergillus carlsbadensis]|nr:hypothetical protein BJY00DRAFT_192093 [Aspergillus carlsbadensis]
MQAREKQPRRLHEAEATQQSGRDVHRQQREPVAERAPRNQVAAISQGSDRFIYLFFLLQLLLRSSYSFFSGFSNSQIPNSGVWSQARPASCHSSTCLVSSSDRSRSLIRGFALTMGKLIWRVTHHCLVLTTVGS